MFYQWVVVETTVSRDPSRPPPFTPEQLLAELATLGVSATTVKHAPVFTVEEAKAVRASLAVDGTHIKNLFLRDKKKNMWLVIVHEDHRVDLKALAQILDARHLSFGSPERLMQHLGVIPGAVTPLSVINDHDHLVNVVLDARVANADTVHCHPLSNDMTTAIRVCDLRAFFAHTGHAPIVVDFVAATRVAAPA